MDHGELVSHADLDYNGTVPRAEEGMPIGNGRMGSLIWTSPTALKFQVNRPDVVANGPSSEASFINDRDYGFGCGFVDIDLADCGDDVFDKSTRQHLDVYSALYHAESNGITVDGFADANADRFLFRVEDRREHPDTVTVRLRSLRPTEVKFKDHVALSRFIKHGNDEITLHQVFSEKDFYCTSALTVKVTGRCSRVRFNNENGGEHTVLNDRDFEELYDPAIADKKVDVTLVGLGAESETEMRICMPEGRGVFYVLLATAASFKKTDDVVAASRALLTDAAENYDGISEKHRDYWHSFWSRSYVRLWGNENAEFIEKHYTYYQYILACCSRGTDFAPNFGGLLFSPRGDFRHWGNMQWWNNINLTYNAVLPTGHTELIRPYLNMYSNAYDSWKTAARQQWGAEGIYIGETVHMMGLEKLPDDIAEELKNFLLGRGPKKFYECSEKFRRFARAKNDMECRWNFLAGNRGSDDCDFAAFVTHLLSSTGNMAFQYYLYYTYTLDEDYLRKVAYPMVRGAAEFYRTYPGVRKEADGLYHINHVSHGEGNWNGRDSNDTLTAIHGIVPLAIKLAKQLGVDEQAVQRWEEFNANLVPLPLNTDPDAPDGETKAYPKPIWVTCHIGPDTNPVCDRINAFFPCVQMEYCTTLTKRFAPDRFEHAENTLHFLLDGKDMSELCSYEMAPWPRILANMGNGEYLLSSMVDQINCVCAPRDHILYRQNGSKSPYANRLTAREGINAISAQRLGNIAAGLQLGLLQCNGGSTELDPVITVFPAWDPNYNAEYTLWAKGGFKVSASMTGGVIGDVVIESTLGGTCRVMAPWKKTTVSGADADEKDGILTFPTEKGAVYTLSPKKQATAED